MPFANIISTFTTEIIPSFFKPKPERNPGNTALGYYLDLINTIDPKIAAFDDGVSTILTTMRKTNINPMMVGLIVDDALKLKGTFYHPFEYFIGREDVRKKVLQETSTNKGIKIGSWSVKQCGDSLE